MHQRLRSRSEAALLLPLMMRTVQHSAVIWLLLRMLQLTLLVLSGDPARALHAGGAARIGMIAGTGLLAAFDRRRFREGLFYANLGIPGYMPWTVSLVTALVLDLALQAALFALGG